MYVNILGRNPLERELEKEGIMKNVHFLTEQETWILRHVDGPALGGRREKRPGNRREGVGEGAVRRRCGGEEGRNSAMF